MDNDDNAEMQMIEYQIRQIQQVLENIDSQLNEVAATKDALLELATLKGDEESFFPLANGVFVKGRLSDQKIVRMNVGSGVVVEKPIEDACIMMDKQYKDIEEYKTQLMQQLDKMIRKMQSKE